MKTTTHYRKSVLILMAFCLIWQYADAQSIKSTFQGGDWHSASTWEGGVVPGKSDQVIIDSRVYLNTLMEEPDTCFSLTVMTNGSLISVANTVSNLTVLDDLINAGTISNPEDNNFILVPCGNLMNYGTIENVFIMAKTDTKVNKITGTFESQIFFLANSDTTDFNFLVVGKAHFKKFISLQTRVVIDDHAEMTILRGSLEGIFDPDTLLLNKGILIEQTIRNFQWTYFHPAGYLNLIFADTYGECTDPALTTYGSRCHPGMNSSVARWWRLTAGNEKDSIDPYRLELSYADAELNGIDENKLHVYLSKDEGITWTKISTAENMFRDHGNKTVTVGTEDHPITAGGGDIILASGDDDISIPSSISVSIIGPDQIRVGAPNHYKIAYWNNGTQNTGTFFIKVKTEGGIEIDKMISHYPGDNTPVAYDINDINPYGDKTYGFFLVDGLGPREYASFDMIFNCLPGSNSLKSADGTLAALPAIGVVGLYVVGGLVVNYVMDVMTGSCYEMIFNDNTTIMDAAKSIYEGGIKKTNAEYTVSTPLTTIGSNIAADLMALAGLALWPADLIKSFWDCIDDIAEGLPQVKDEKRPEKVTSCDPNSKYGPSGFGDQNYMSQLNPMIYMIRFENLKDAAAPAYKIVVKDILDEEIFDLASVESMGMSHDMGTFSLDGNILTWEFVAIELPPNKLPPEGEGWVAFKVNLKDNLESGTQIKNSATITFDLNAPIQTNETINTLDFDAPSSVPDDFPAIVSTRSVTVKWSSDDGNGSGIDLAYVYSSVNNGPFSLTGTTASREMQIQVTPGFEYKFFVLSKDNVGNVEASPGKIVSTKVLTSAGNFPELEFVKIYPNPAQSSFTVDIQLKNPGKIGISVFDIHGRMISDLNDVPAGNSAVIPVELNHPSPGMYFVKIQTGNNTYCEKILIY